MKKLLTLLLLTTVVVAQETLPLRLVDGVNQLEKGIEMAKREEADQRNPYSFEKARACRQVAYLLASSLDESGSRIFLIKGFNALSKAVNNKPELDRLEPVRGERSRGLESFGIFVDDLFSKLNLARDNRGLFCAPRELARAEVFYDALAYELSKPRPSSTHVVDFYNKAQGELNSALDKIKIAREGNLECYTGKPFVPELAKPQTETPPTPTAETLPRKEEPPPQDIGLEMLMVTARVHFDFGKHSIKKEYIPTLNEIVRALRENPSIRVRIEGFTDNIGSKAYNDRLALRRAQSVRDYLIRAGIPSERIEVAGFGKERYIEDNSTPEGRLANRRAEFIVIQVPGQ